MPEGRMLKKRISESKKLGTLRSDSARLLYTWLIPHLDIDGRHSADPEIIKGHIFPKIKSMTVVKIKKLLNELNEMKLIILYSSKGENYLQFVIFEELQKLSRDREAKSNIPEPTQEQIKKAHENSRFNHENSLLIKVNKNKVKLNKAQNDTFKKEFEEFWKFFRSIGNLEDDTGDKPEALKAYKILRRNESREMIAKATHGYEDFLKTKRLDDGFEQRKMYGSTFLRSKKWKRFLDFKYEPKL